MASIPALEEAPASARRREEEAKGKIGATGPVVLCGAGHLGRKCLAALKAAGFEVAGWVDQNPALQGSVIDGLTVASPEQAVLAWGRHAEWYVTIFRGYGDEGMAARCAAFSQVLDKPVGTFLALGWAVPGILPHFAAERPSILLGRAEAFLQVASLFADSLSQRTFAAQMAWRLTGDFSGSGTALGEQYFPLDLLLPNSSERFVDAGAYDGDTLRRIPWGFAAAWAFEPDPSNARRLRETVPGTVKVIECLLGAQAGHAEFDALGTVASRRGEGAQVSVDTLDRLLAHEEPTFLKFDIEGDEVDALKGAEGLLARCQPVVAICLYHRPFDLVDIPLYLKSLLPDHRFFLRSHQNDGFELVLYAIPSERLTPQARPGMPTERPCPVCGAHEAEPLHRQRFVPGALGEGYQVAVCSRCGAGFAEPAPSPELLERYYSAQSKYTYSSSGGTESAFDFKRFEAIADQIEAVLPERTARILDIGCATGGLLAVLARRGYTRVEGADPSAACAAAAKGLYGIPVRVSSLAEVAASAERFDAVLLVGVLEHLHDPLAAVSAVGGILSRGGLLYCAQPDAEAFSECVNAPYQQFSSEHLTYFSSETLTRMMAGAGLAPRQTWRWLVEWREGITDSVVSGAYARAEALTSAVSATEGTRAALLRYLSACRQADRPLQAWIEERIRSGEPLLLWGAGTLTRRLLASSRLPKARIVAIVDSNASLHGTHLLGFPVIAPEAISDCQARIAVISKAFEKEIREAIASKYRLTNPVVTLP